jgi:hypothetical protein
MPTARLLALAIPLFLGLPASAMATANWGFGPPGKSSATITWEPDSGKNVSAVEFTLPVKVKSAKKRIGGKCTVSRRHPKVVRCAISPVTAYGYVDVLTKVHIPCASSFGFRVKPEGGRYFVRQQPIRSGNGCG